MVNYNIYDRQKPNFIYCLIMELSINVAVFWNVTSFSLVDTWIH